MAAHSLRRDLPNERGNILGISIHNSLTGEVIATIAEGGIYKFPLAINPTLRTVVGADNNGFAFAWDISSGEMLWEARIAMERPRNVSAAFSSDGSMIAIISNDKRIIYDAATGDEISTLALDEDAVVHEVAFLDVQHLAGCVAKQGVVVWDVATGAVSYEHAVEATRLSNDGRLALVPDVTTEETRQVLNAIDIISTESGELIRKFVIHERMVLRNYDFDPEGGHVIVATYQVNGPIVAFHIESGEVVGRTSQALSFGLHMRPISGLRALTSSFDDRIHVWDLNNTSDRRVADEPARIRCIDMTGDGRIAVSGETKQGHLHLWDLETDRVTAVFEIPVAPGTIRGVTISDDGGTILAHSSSTVFRVDPATGQVTTLLEWPLGRDVNIWTLQISGDGSAAIVTSRERVIVFDPTNANILQRMDGSISADISRDGGILLVGNRYYNRNTGDQYTIEGIVGSSVSLSDDGSRAIDYWLYYGGILWNLATVSPLAGGAVQWKEDLPSGSGVGTEADSDLSADGRYTVSRDLDGQLVVIDTQLQKQIATLTLDDNVFLDLVMSDDGSTILVATQMGRLHHFRIENLPGAEEGD